LLIAHCLFGRAGALDQNQKNVAPLRVLAYFSILLPFDPSPWPETCVVEPVFILRKFTIDPHFQPPNLIYCQGQSIFMQRIEFHIIILMKRPYLLSLLLLLTTACFSQEVIRQQSCSNDLINRQVDSLKTTYSKDGYVLLKEASIMMESEFEMPVIVPLTEGSWYQFVFIGDYTSRLYEVRMFDWNERQVIFQQKRWGEIDGNIISYSYIPKFSEFHMMKPVQVNKQKKKNLCGYVMLFKKANPNTQQSGSVTP
jgi:hypothetical protein